MARVIPFEHSNQIRRVLRQLEAEARKIPSIDRQGTAIASELSPATILEELRRREIETVRTLAAVRRVAALQAGRRDDAD